MCACIEDEKQLANAILGVYKELVEVIFAATRLYSLQTVRYPLFGEEFL